MLELIVPYRNRPDQLQYFTNHMKWFHNVHVTIVEQTDEKPFNRGRLLNIGFIETVTPDTKLVCFHDIDMIPRRDYPDYHPAPVIQYASSSIQKKDYLGGVTLFSTEAFIKSEGYHNDYFHRAEDNEQMFNLKNKKIRVYAFPIGFDYIPHPRTGPEFIPELWQKAQLPRTKNMLKTCDYELISKEVYDTHVHLKVAL